MKSAKQSPSHVSSPRPPSPQAAWLWTGIAALAFGLITTGIVRLFQGGKPSADLTLTSVLVFLTVGAAGGWSWWLLLARRGRVSEGRGALAGALTALLGYLLIFQVANLVYGAAAPTFLGFSPLAKVLGGLILSVATLIFSGWFVIPLLALAGAGLAMAQIAVAPSLEGGLIARMRGLSQGSASLLQTRPLVRAIVALVCVAGLLVTSAGVWVWSRPLFIGDLAAEPAPVTDYGASIAAIDAQIAAEAADPTLSPECATRLFTPGRRTERVIIFLHGFTNCPAQFVPLAEQFVARGYSVYIPRVPHHGFADRLTEDLARLSADELVRFASRSVDLARGLGEQVAVVGLSMGATIAAWIAQHRGDVAQVTLIAPLFQITGLPPFAIRPVASTILAVPNFYLWWDDQRREQIIGPPYAYPRYPVHAAGALLRLSFAVQDAAERGPPAVRAILLVSNAADGAVSNPATEAIGDDWARNGAAVRRYTFPADLGLNHDLIDVNNPEQRVALVYPTLISLIEVGGTGRVTP